MPQSLHPAHQLFLNTPGALPGVGIARRIAVALEFGQSELRELQRVFEIFCPVLVMNRQLFAGLDAIRRVAGAGGERREPASISPRCPRNHPRRGK